VLDGLIAVGILSHIRNLHLPDFMDRKSIVAVIKYRRQHKHGIKLAYKGLMSAHELGESFHILENRPGIMPAVALCKCVAPFEWIEWQLKIAIPVLSTH